MRLRAAANLEKPNATLHPLARNGWREAERLACSMPTVASHRGCVQATSGVARPGAAQADMLPNSNGRDSAEERYEACVRWWNVAVSRYNAAADAYESAQAELRDAGCCLDEARGDLDRAAAVLGLPGAP